MPSDWGVENAGDITDLDKTQPATALAAYGNFVEAVYNTTIGCVLKKWNYAWERGVSAGKKQTVCS